MSKSLYIAAVEPRSGKSVAALGTMELLSKRIRSVAYFRPVIPSADNPDNNLRLIHSRYQLTLSYEEMYAYTHDEAQRLASKEGEAAVIKGILAKYKALEDKHRFVLCEGTDFTGISSAFEFEFNAEVASNLGCPLLVMVNGRNLTAAQLTQAVIAAQEAFSSKGCTIAATIINRVDSDLVSEAVRGFQIASPALRPVYALPESPSLAKPTIGEIAEGLGAQFLYGEAAGLNREVKDFKVAAMGLANFLNFVAPDDLIITPGDRTDIILGSLATVVSETYPHIAGLLLTGGLALEPQVQRLIQGSAQKVPTTVLQVETDTYTTAMNASQVQPALTPENDRKIASALGLFESHVDLEELESRIQVVRSTRKTPIMFEYELIERARENRQHIVLPEGTDERILRAAEILLYRRVADLTLLGNPKKIQDMIGSLGLELEGVGMIDPVRSDRQAGYVNAFYQLRAHKGISREMAADTVTDVNYFGTMMIHEGDADGMVSGAAHTTAETIRPALQIIRTRPEVSVVSSVFFMCLADRVLVYGDCAVNPDPNAQQLADIAVNSAETAKMYGIEPRVAMCSYSTGASGRGKDVEKVRRATQLARERRPDIPIEGPIQYDAAIDAGVARSKLPDSQVAGRATVFIFPDLNTGNNLYKAVQRSANAVAVGPVLQGLNKPVNDLSRGCTVPDIINTVAITAIQAQMAKR